MEVDAFLQKKTTPRKLSRSRSPKKPAEENADGDGLDPIKDAEEHEEGGPKTK